MGSNTSKTNESGDNSQIKDSDANLNPEDPRSPTPEIARTPLQGKTGSKHNITKNADLRKAFEVSNGDEKLIHNNPILSAVIKNHLKSYDPRSPTQDFERTPIVINPKIDESDENGFGSPSLNNDNTYELNDSCTEAVESDPDTIVPKNLFKELCDLSLKEIDEPLGSSTASNEAIEENMSTSNYKGLLETNFHYVENNGTVIDTLSAENNDNETLQRILQVPAFEILNCDPRSPSVGIERTPIVVVKTDEEANEDNVETMSDDTLIKVLQNTNSELRQAMKPQNKEGVLIYEDEADTLNDTPKKPKSSSSSGCRTPLSCMKNKADSGHARSKSANTLHNPKDTKLQSKIPKRVSHIPRLKTQSRQTKVMPSESSISLRNISKAAAIGGDCENTPPHSHRDRWDQDNSVVL